MLGGLRRFRGRCTGMNTMAVSRNLFRKKPAKRPTCTMPVKFNPKLHKDPHTKNWVDGKRRARLEGFAYENRRDLTAGEKAMEMLLIGLGWRFNIEHPKHDLYIICDFLVPQYGLIVEVDGGYHAKQKDKDVRRDHSLVKKGLMVQRFTNEQVINYPRRTRATLLNRVETIAADRQTMVVYEK